MTTPAINAAAGGMAAQFQRFEAAAARAGAGEGSAAKNVAEMKSADAALGFQVGMAKVAMDMQESVLDLLA
mgnify:CR=1 FL=1